MAKIYGDEKGARYQWEKLKGQPISEKIKYIWEYYGTMIIVIIASIAIIVSITSSIMYNMVPNVISGELYSNNSNEEDIEKLRVIMCDAMGYDEKDYHISIGSSFYSSTDLEELYTISEKFMAQVAAHSLDFLSAPAISLNSFFSSTDPDNRAFSDLRTVLPEDLLTRLEQDERILYAQTDEAGMIPIAVHLNGTNIGSLLGVVDGVDSYAACVITSDHKDAYTTMIQLIYQDIPQ